MCRPYDVHKIEEGLYLVERACSCGRLTQAKVSSQALWDRENGAKVQDAFPEMDNATREALFMTGMCSACWDNLFEPEEDDLEGEDTLTNEDLDEQG